MPEDGWIKVYRSLLDSAVWRCSTAEHKAILVAVMLMANHVKKSWEWKKKKFEVQPGQFITSLDNLAAKAGKDITPRHVRTALKNFEKLDFLTNESSSTGRLITVKSWDRYQATEFGDDKAAVKARSNPGQSPVKPRSPNKNDKNDKNDKTKKTETGIDPEFDLFWTAYPRKLKKADALKAWQKAMRKPPIEYILEQLEKWKGSGDWTKEGGRYVPHPTTWINGERWNDEPYGYGSTGYNWREEEDRPKDWSTVPNSDWILEDWPGDVTPQ